jgi:hypothetical protein
MIVLACACSGEPHRADVDTVGSKPASIAIAAPPPPPCIRETCAERPHAFQCVAYRNGFGSHADIYACARFEIEYEHHCVCDEWGEADRRRDGGVL